MSVNTELLYMGLISRRASKRVLFKPELIEAALSRLDCPLPLDRQKVVLRAVGNPSKVAWPDWWEAS